LRNSLAGAFVSELAVSPEIAVELVSIANPRELMRHQAHSSVCCRPAALVTHSPARLNDGVRYATWIAGTRSYGERIIVTS
jgi:hypothetical protein